MIFADTGFFFALGVPYDQWHRLAVRGHDPKAQLVTSSAVVSETVSLFQIRGYFSLALEFLERIRTDANTLIVYPDHGLQAAAWDEFKISGSFGASAVDCMSFVIMRKLGVRKAYTFDRDHFQRAGFETL